MQFIKDNGIKIPKLKGMEKPNGKKDQSMQVTIKVISFMEKDHLLMITGMSIRGILLKERLKGLELMLILKVTCMKVSGRMI